MGQGTGLNYTIHSGTVFMECKDKSSITTRKLQISRVAIITKKDSSRADACAEEISAWLKAQSITAITGEIPVDTDLILVLGGDGTLLHIAEKAARHAIPIAGFNLGSLGFLTEFTKDEVKESISRILTEHVTIQHRLMLKTRLVTADKKYPYSYALNEIVINKNTLDRLLKLETYGDDSYINTYKTDGLIFSTPTGSTAYNLSAGGPLVHPGLNTILVTPICPFMLSSRPIILPSTLRISVGLQSIEGVGCAQVIVDGQQKWEMKGGETLELETAGQPLQLISASSRDYYTILRNKLHWGNQDK